ncbi:leucyl/phenylalanyl-tRNA--protein transferase [Natronocella acetinitrilica]|uniref:Leucyl/phenylalanyl-tRNA--protein transferase n=1 Tax=Natronocella acetinitrilica TaxID=414046 RepID=A0AAE3G803_9GAMM|nr:leucyl/phenylalanyl-tRNA--protein transferase [Natronocella acetinitrilica]MCP1676108.1 leucyl/phenylalanyl-tRNA--protein transferase [Natronocella acetinitrilica]
MAELPITWLPTDGAPEFPPIDNALPVPNGLLAVGGSLDTARLELAYKRGIFPWFEEGQPVLWWSPDPRTLIYTDQLHISRSLRRSLRRPDYTVSLDRAFPLVMRRCAAPRPGQKGTWITRDMFAAYVRLHQRGQAHSVEVWRGEALIGGLYGVSLGRGFFGESMFSDETNGSKIALTWLVRQLRRWQFPFLDCQVGSGHLYSLGAVDVPRRRFQQELNEAVAQPPPPGPHWQFDGDFHPLDES